MDLILFKGMNVYAHIETNSDGIVTGRIMYARYEYYMSRCTCIGSPVGCSGSTAKKYCDNEGVRYFESVASR